MRKLIKETKPDSTIDVHEGDSIDAGAFETRVRGGQYGSWEANDTPSEVDSPCA